MRSCTHRLDVRYDRRRSGIGHPRYARYRLGTRLMPFARPFLVSGEPPTVRDKRTRGTFGVVRVRQTQYPSVHAPVRDRGSRRRGRPGCRVVCLGCRRCLGSRPVEGASRRHSACTNGPADGHRSLADLPRANWLYLQLAAADALPAAERRAAARAAIHSRPQATVGYTRRYAARLPRSAPTTGPLSNRHLLRTVRPGAGRQSDLQRDGPSRSRPATGRRSVQRDRGRP